MILTFDVGNTETTIALFEGDDVRRHWRVTTGVPRTPDEWSLLLRGLLRASPDSADVSRIGICSVVPPVTGTLVAACRPFTPAAPLVIDARSPLPIRLQVEEPLTVGADRIVNTLAASTLYRRDCIVVDLGTATTYDCITADGVFLGGVIQPGIQTSAETLTRRTSQLPATALAAPERVIGRRTEECIRAGLLYGAVEAIDGIVRRIKREWPTPSIPFVVATGGLAELVVPHCREVEAVDPLLTLRGVRRAVEMLDSQHVA